jgi:hypothetical protein
VPTSSTSISVSISIGSTSTSVATTAGTTPAAAPNPRPTVLRCLPLAASAHANGAYDRVVRCSSHEALSRGRVSAELKAAR